MLLDSGVCTIYELRDGGTTGVNRAYRLREKSRHCFKELTVGYERHYEARRSNESVDKSLRIWRDTTISTTDICEVNGQRFRICQIQPREDEDGMLVTDLALELTTGWEITDAEVLPNED